MLESSRMESLGMSVTVLMSSYLLNAVSGVSVSFIMMSSALSCLSKRGSCCERDHFYVVSACRTGVMVSGGDGDMFILLDALG